MRASEEIAANARVMRAMLCAWTFACKVAVVDGVERRCDVARLN